MAKRIGDARWIGLILISACIAALLLVVLMKRSEQRERAVRPAPETVERYADINKIDVHVHVPPERYGEAARVFQQHGVVLALNASGGHPGRGLEETVEAGLRLNGAIRSYCNLSFGGVENAAFHDYAIRTLNQCKEQGGVGLKIFKSLGLGAELSDGSLLRVDDPRLDVVFETAGELELPVLIHAGDPQAFFRPPTRDNERYEELRAHPSWSFHGDEWPSWEEVFAQYEARVARHPNTIFLGAHFGNAPEEPQRVARMLERYPNLYIETGARIPEIGRHDPAPMREMFIRFRERILFGTDIQMGSESWILGSAGAQPDPPSRIPFFYASHWRYFETAERRFEHPTPIQGEWTIDGIDLPREVLEDLYHRNAERIFGFTRRADAEPDAGGPPGER